MSNLYSFSPIEPTGWMAVVEQPKEIAYKPVSDLLGKITLPAIWLILLTAVGAWLAGKFTRRQAEAARRIEREVIFNEKILANMPSGIALVDPSSRNFLQANEAFAAMAKQFGGLDETKDVYDVSYDEVKIAPSEAIEKVLAFGAPFQIVEQPFVDRSGATHFVNVNLLRLQGSEQRIQGVLYLVEDKTRDVTLRQELIGANAAKDQFLALLSHELRNPLSPVIAMVGELEASAPDSPKCARAGGDPPERRAGSALDRRSARRDAHLEREAAAQHRDGQRARNPAARLRDLPRGHCRERTADGVPSARRARPRGGDPARLQQVFWNLIKNSVKFTPAQGRIVIETYNPGADEIEIRTTDTGIGIEPEKIGKIFNAFEQGQSSITRRFGGLGLGLAISKAMVDAHNGRITVSSDGRDSGATFTVTLHTIATPALAEAPQSTTAPTITRQPGRADEPRAAKPRPAPTGARLLVVDDHHDTVLGLKMMLERRGYRVTTANSADEAVERAEAAEFDLMISDIGLPDRSGYELMQELRSTKSLRGIALSGFGMENDISRARAAGFSEHLTKPINFERLEEAIHNLLDLEPTAPTKS
jgi:signal transduction histidine kinase/CheY-like chemotaxis protein